jgi:hypothetical protein
MMRYGDMGSLNFLQEWLQAITRRNFDKRREIEKEREREIG